MFLPESAGSGRVRIPRFLGTQNAAALFLLCSRLRDADDDVTLDAAALEFVDPLGLAVLGATLEGLQVRLTLDGLQPDVASYLNRMDLFSRCTVGGLSPARAVSRLDQSNSLVELTCVDERREVDNAAHRLARAIVGRFPDADPDEPRDEMTCVNRFDRYIDPLQYALSELLENALSHARLHGRGQAKVWVAAQYYRQRGTVRLAVVDNGCGFLETLRTHRELASVSHQSAIIAALKPRVSCNREVGLRLLQGESVNQGVGLTTTFRIAEAAGGGLTIVSGDGCHDTQGCSAVLPQPAYWPGVAVSLVCKRDRLVEINRAALLPALDAPHVPVHFEH